MRPASAELGLRIEGQSRDVACELELVPASGAGCAALADQHGALAVMTVREPQAAGSYEVVVCDAVASTEQVRSVTLERGDALGTSAAFEAVALVVRSALHDIAAAHEARRADHVEREGEARAADERARREAEQRARVAQEPAPEDDDDEEDEEEPDAAARAFRFAIGGEGVWVAKRTVAVALMARAYTELGTLRIGLGLSFGLPGTSHPDEGQPLLKIARHTALVLALLPLELSSRWAFEPGLHAGITAITRQARSTLSGIEPTADVTHWSAVLGAELGLNLALATWCGVRWHIGLEVVPGAPDYAYRDVSSTGMPLGETVRSSAFPVQPRFGLTLFAEL